MKTSIIGIVLSVSAAAVPVAAAADKACAPILKAQIAQSRAQRYIVKTTIAGERGSDESETMIVPEGMFIRRDGKWTKSSTQLTPKDRAELIEFGEKNISDCKRIGKESLRGKAMSIYTYKQKAPDLPSSDVKLWIGADGLPRKLEARSGNSSVAQVISYNAKLRAPR